MAVYRLKTAERATALKSLFKIYFQRFSPQTPSCLKSKSFSDFSAVCLNIAELFHYFNIVMKQKCDLLSSVAEVLEEEDDCTILVAVTASLAALLLLVLLSICTVLCYRQCRKASRHFCPSRNCSK